MRKPHFDVERERLEQSPDDWQFGALSQDCIYSVPEKKRLDHLPVGELQFGSGDYMDCASRGPVNILETKFTYAYREGIIKPENRKWLEDNGYVQDGRITFSDRFVAVGSGTTKSGNSLKAPIDFVHRSGLIPKKMLPKVEGSSWEEHHDPSKITEAMKKLGQEFAARFSVNYEKVYAVHFPELAKDDLLDVALFAWEPQKDGIYPDPGTLPPNHVVAVIRPQYFVADNYLDDSDGDFIKQLAGDFTFFEYGYRVFVSRETVPSEQLSFLQALLNWLKSILKEAGQVVPPPAYDTDPKELPMNKLSLLELAQQNLGKNVRTGAAPRELACVESVCNILRQAYPETPKLLHTKELYDWLKKSPHFKASLDIKPGSVIVSVTGTGNGNVPHGHAGIVLNGGRVASNTSANGLWEDNYSVDSWAQVFRNRGGMKLRVFEPLSTS